MFKSHEHVTAGWPFSLQSVFSLWIIAIIGFRHRGYGLYILLRTTRIFI